MKNKRAEKKQELYQAFAPVKKIKKDTIAMLAKTGRKHLILRYPIFILLFLFIVVANLLQSVLIHIRLKEKLYRGVAWSLITILIFTTTGILTYAINEMAVVGEETVAEPEEEPELEVELGAEEEPELEAEPESEEEPEVLEEETMEEPEPEEEIIEALEPEEEPELMVEQEPEPEDPELEPENPELEPEEPELEPENPELEPEEPELEPEPRSETEEELELEPKEPEQEAEPESEEEPEVLEEESEEEPEALEEETMEEPEPVVEAVFAQSQIIEDTLISVYADAGVFPLDAVLVVSLVENVETIEKINEVVDDVRQAGKKVGVSYVYDISIRNQDGEEILPNNEKGDITVTFALTEVQNSNLNAEIYHVSGEDTDNLSAESLTTNINENKIEIVTSSFSFYTVEFTYQGLQYVMNGEEQLPLSEILNELGLSGNVSNVTTSNETLLEATMDQEVWIITSIQAFLTNEWIRVTIDEVEYEITCTDRIMPVTIANAGYAYGKDMNEDSITLVTEIQAGTALRYQWKYATSKEGIYTPIEGANASEYTFTPTDSYWYKCTVNGITDTIPIEAISTSNNQYSFLNACFQGNWYLSNDTMAYVYDENIFDVVGKYEKGGVTYWMNTSYNTYWTMYSSALATPEALDPNSESANLDALRISFDVNDDRQIILEADLHEGEQSFSFGCDVMLANYSITQYCDSASLKAIKGNDGLLTQVQMVGALSVDSALETDPAFVFKPVTSVSNFWLGDYYDRKQYAYNTTEAGSNTIMDTYSGISVVSEVRDLDSGMTASWTGIPSGDKIKFQFSVGAVSETGAQITANTNVTSTTVTILEVDSDYYYALYNEEDEKVCDWVAGTAAVDNAINFTNLVADTVYVVKIIHKDQYNAANETGNSSGADATEISTAIDPVEQGVGDEESQPHITKSRNTVTITNANTAYTYRLLTESGSPATAYVAPVEGTVLFENLESGTTYYLVAKTNTNQYSDRVSVTTVSCEEGGGHEYGEPEFHWTESNNCSAEFSCIYNAEHTVSFDCTVTSETLDEASCTEEGQACYTASITKFGHTYLDEILVDIDELGHSYGEPEFVWSEDKSTCNAVFTCSREGCEAQNFEDCEIDSVITESTCTAAGHIEYTATVGFQGQDYEDVTISTLTRLEHIFTRYTYDEGTANYLRNGTETAYCDRDECNGTDTREAAGTRMVDTIAPMVEIQLRDSSWRAFLNQISFGLFFRDSQQVNIHVTDGESGVYRVSYCLAEAALSENLLQAADITWTDIDNHAAFSVNANHKWIVYAKACDMEGNTTIINSDGMVIFSDSTQNTQKLTYISGVNQELSAKVNLNGNSIAEICNDGNGLLRNVHYVVDDNGGITFQSSYLQTLAEGDYILTISYHPYGMEHVSNSENDIPEKTTIALTVRKPQLISITVPSSLVDVPNGTPKVASALGLSDTVQIETENKEITSAKVNWNLAECTYDVLAFEKQTFDVTGMIEVPVGVEQGDVVTYFTIQVTVSEGRKESVEEQTVQEKTMETPVEISPSIDHTKEETGKTTVEVRGKENTPETIIENDITTLENQLLTEEEKEQVRSGEDARIYLDIKDISDEITQEEKEFIDTQLGENEMGIYIDISLYKQIGEKEPELITNSNGMIQISIKVPENLLCSDKEIFRTFRVMREHNGVMTMIEGTFDQETGFFTFETELFSTYALVYNDLESTKLSSGIGFTTYYIIAFVVILLGLFCYFLWLNKKKKDETQNNS